MRLRGRDGDCVMQYRLLTRAALKNHYGAATVRERACAVTALAHGDRHEKMWNFGHTRRYAF